MAVHRSWSAACRAISKEDWALGVRPCVHCLEPVDYRVADYYADDSSEGERLAHIACEDTYQAELRGAGVV